MIGIDCISSCKSNYHTITTTTAPNRKYIIKLVILEPTITYWIDIAVLALSNKYSHTRIQKLKSSLGKLIKGN